MSDLDGLDPFERDDEHATVIRERDEARNARDEARSAHAKAAKALDAIEDFAQDIGRRMRAVMSNDLASPIARGIADVRLAEMREILAIVSDSRVAPRDPSVAKAAEVRAVEREIIDASLDAYAEAMMETMQTDVPMASARRAAEAAHRLFDLTRATRSGS